MRSVCIVFFLSGLVTHSFAQLAEPLNFNEKTHDFGEILEQKGNAVFDFVFTNNSGRPIRIISVQASCGCTTPAWTKEPVAPGKTGFIKASFDPKGRPGFFNKSLTVQTDLSGTPISLQIKGTVVNQLTAKDELLPVANGNLKFKATSFNVGKVFVNKEINTSEFPMLNAGKEVIQFISAITPPYIQVLTPASLQPGERGIISIKYDAKLKKQFGFQSDNIELKTTDAGNENKSFSVFASIEEFFPTLSAEEQAKAPVLVIERYDVDFLRVKPDIEFENSIVFQNKGKKNLELRYVQSNCSCLTAALDKQLLKPGEIGKITLKFNTEGRSGTQNKAVTVYSNDPKNPVQRITVTGYVEE